MDALSYLICSLKRECNTYSKYQDYRLSFAIIKRILPILCYTTQSLDQTDSTLHRLLPLSGYKYEYIQINETGIYSGKIKQVEKILCGLFRLPVICFFSFFLSFTKQRWAFKHKIMTKRLCIDNLVTTNVIITQPFLQKKQWRPITSPFEEALFLWSQETVDINILRGLHWLIGPN